MFLTTNRPIMKLGNPSKLNLVFNEKKTDFNIQYEMITQIISL